LGVARLQKNRIGPENCHESCLIAILREISGHDGDQAKEQRTDHNRGSVPVEQVQDYELDDTQYRDHGKMGSIVWHFAHRSTAVSITMSVHFQDRWIYE
jgi:hypothetical protein